MKSVVCRFMLLMGLSAGFCVPLLASTICVTVHDQANLRFPPGAALVRIVDLSNPDNLVSIMTDRESKACSEDLPDGLYYVEVSSDSFMNVRYYPIPVNRTEDVTLTVRLHISWASILPLVYEAEESER